MRKNSRTVRICVIVACVVIAIVIAVPLYLLFGPAPVYETNGIADYGVVKGNYNNNAPKRFISSFFPEEIESYFSDVTYHYKAIKGDTYAYEMQLEFVIKDTDKYTAFLSDVIGDAVCEPFRFDSDYQAYYVANYLTLTRLYEDKLVDPKENPLHIGNAKVGLVLFSEKEQRFVFVALGMFDGGGATVEELGFFFDRFEIDPQAYAMLADHEYAGPGT
ncbi:MAG: hypothetical protein IKL13_02590 [Clostridia bacterium]|nr:hypothetical protein [Clostridia bacterium]